MKQRYVIILVGAAIAFCPMVAHASSMKHKPGHSKMAAATTYKCVKCGMSYSAADAKKMHYKCSMDGGKLVAVTSSHKKSTM